VTDVINPSPVPIRMFSATSGAYLNLSRALREAADLAGRYALALTGTPEGPTADLTDEQRRQVADWSAVRDALRNAATEALVPRGGTGRPSCRRCKIECPFCSPAPAADTAPPVVVVLTAGRYGGTRVVVQRGQTVQLVLNRVDRAEAVSRGWAPDLLGTVAASLRTDGQVEVDLMLDGYGRWRYVLVPGVTYPVHVLAGDRAGAELRGYPAEFLARIATVVDEPVGEVEVVTLVDGAGGRRHLVDERPAAERDGMSHLYDCCTAAPTEPHTDDCTRGPR
jgi:hypothetical protein